MYQEILKYLENNYSEKVITENDMDNFKVIINKKNIIYLLKEIIEDEKLLDEISKRSYTHALGFDKIVLIKLEDKSCKPELRLHLWYPDVNGVPLVESLHEHSFNFISTVLTGKLENQVFELSSLNFEELNLLDKFISKFNKLSFEDKLFINNQIEILESLKLKNKNSNQYDDMSLNNVYDKEKAKKILEINDYDWNLLSIFQGHFVSNRKAGEKKSYKHIFSKYVKLTPFNILKINESEYYFHPYQYPHRLYYDNKILNSTVLITTKILENPQGGSLQRPSYLEESEKKYEKISISKNDLKNKLIDYLYFLENKD